MQINIGLSNEQRKAISDGLSKVLADTYSLYLMTQNYHWNVTGPMFNSLHMMFEEQYTELQSAIDEIAERIRALGYKAPGSWGDFRALTVVKEGNNELKAEDMIADLVESQEAVARTCREVFSTANVANDQPTSDLLTRRLEIHDKAAWMLRSMLV